MSTRYHINPDSGRVNICRTTSGQCPFGGLPHGRAKEETRELFEKHMEYQQRESLRKSQPKPKPSPGEKAMAPWLEYLKKKLEYSKNDPVATEALRADYSRAVSFSQKEKSRNVDAVEEKSLDSYIEYLAEKLPSRMGRSYLEQARKQAEYNRIVAFARRNKLTSR